MGSVVRALSALAVILGAALSALWVWTIGTFAPLAAVTALMMGGTGHSLLSPDTDEFVTEYLGAMGDNYVGPAVTRWSTPADRHTLTGRVAVYSPEHFWPVSGNQTFDDSVADGLTNLNSCIARTIASTTPPSGTRRPPTACSWSSDIRRARASPRWPSAI